MPILEDAKEYVQRATGLCRPGQKHAPEFARPRKPHVVRFKDDGVIPNHPRWPLVIYKGGIGFGEGHDPAAVMEDQEALGFSPGGAFLVNKSSQRSLR